MSALSRGIVYRSGDSPILEASTHTGGISKDDESVQAANRIYDEYL